MVNSNPCSAIWFMFNPNDRFIIMSAKARFNHTIKKAKEQGRFQRSEKQKLNNLFGIMANVQKDLFKNE